jgi:hypothetical protein
MASCYAPDATFRDPVFELTGADIGAMWRMLMPPGAPLRIVTAELRQDGDTFVGRWEADYEFTMTGRRVHNRIESRFRIRDGLIVQQRDSFPFWKWSRMALGAKGLLLGWTPLVRNAVRRKARRRLDQSLGRTPKP